MTDYSSVKNTAKDNRLIRAEIREYTLCLGLLNGFIYDCTVSKKLYPNSQLRQKQFTMLCTDNFPKERSDCLFKELNIYVKYFEQILASALKSYYKHYPELSKTVFYDSKKFRIYRDRLQYGPERSISLNRTVQYFWTPALLTLLFSCCGISKNTGSYSLILSNTHMYKNAYNVEDLKIHLLNYIKNVCNLELENSDIYNSEKSSAQFCCNDIIYFPTIEAAKPYINLVNKTAETVYKKLVIGKYISENLYRQKEV